MKASALKYTILSWVSGFTMLVLLLMPFYGFLTVWSASLFGHYTAIRLWGEGLLVVCTIGILYLLAFDHKIRTHTLSRRLVWTILAYIALNLAWGIASYERHYVTAPGKIPVAITYLHRLKRVTWCVLLLNVPPVSNLYKC